MPSSIVRGFASNRPLRGIRTDGFHNHRFSAHRGLRSRRFDHQDRALWTFVIGVVWMRKKDSVPLTSVISNHTAVSATRTIIYSY